MSQEPCCSSCISDQEGEYVVLPGMDQACCCVHASEVPKPPGVGLAPFSDYDTSLAASKAIVPHLQRLEQVVLDAIEAAGGACDHEIEDITGLMHQTASARRRALVLKGLVEDSGRRRKTASGRLAVVWQVRKP